jgi:hypothetical protein
VIRKIDGSEEGELNALAITKEGEHFVTGGEDTILRIWGYDDGQKYYEGCGHSGAITKVHCILCRFKFHPTRRPLYQ